MRIRQRSEVGRALHSAVAALAAVTAFALIPAALHAADDDSREALPDPERAIERRASFVDGAVQLHPDAAQCSSLPLAGARQRIVDTALLMWSEFGYQTLDMSKLPARSVVGLPLPEAPRPRAEQGQRLVARIAEFWAVAPSGGTYIEKQNTRWKKIRDQEWQDHWSAAFTSWVMCKTGFDQAQFARSVAHNGYINHAKENTQSIFRVAEAGALPRPGDLACANEDVKGSARKHCYVVVRAGPTKTYVVGGNVIDWSAAHRSEFGSVALLVVDTNDFRAVKPSEACDRNNPCWLLVLALKSDEPASAENSPRPVARIMRKAVAGSEPES